MNILLQQKAQHTKRLKKPTKAKKAWLTKKAYQSKMPIVSIDKYLNILEPRPLYPKQLCEHFPIATVNRAGSWGSFTIIQSSDERVNIKGECDNQFVNAAIYAYNTHTGLRINPDDILQCFALAISKFVNENAEKYRAVFVEHEGKKQLTVQIDHLGQFDSFVSRISKMINKNIKTKLDLDSNFSNSTDISRAVAGLTKMATFDQYFGYRMVIMCGIREVDLTGTLDDWILLRKKVVDCLAIFNLYGDLINWGKHFITIIDRLIDTYRGNVDQKFWSRFINYVPYGSGSQRYISGWLQVLVAEKVDDFPEYLNLLDNQSEPKKRVKGEYYDAAEHLAKWCQLLADPGKSTVCVDINTSIGDAEFVIKMHAGHVGWVFTDGFAEAKLGYYGTVKPEESNAEMLRQLRLVPKEKSPQEPPQEEPAIKNSNSYVFDRVGKPVPKPAGEPVPKPVGEPVGKPVGKPTAIKATSCAIL